MTRTIQIPGVTLPEIDDATRREFLIGAAGLLLLPAACGNNGGDDGEASGRMRTVEHSAGTSEVPVSPERVVVIDDTIGAGLVNLGLTLVGASDSFDAVLGDVEELLPDDLDVDEVERIGDAYEPNLESVAAIEPDLIIGADYQEEFYDQLSEIAPTVLVEFGDNGDWRQRFRDVAEVIGRTERAEEVEADYERVISRLPEEVKEATVAFIRPENGQFRIDSLETAFPGAVAADAGIPTQEVPEGVGEVEEGFGFITVSGERLDVVEEADLIVVPDFRDTGGEDSDSISQFEQNGLWETLPAVEEGRIVQVSGTLYNFGNHYSAELLLREIERALA